MSKKNTSILIFILVVLIPYLSVFYVSSHNEKKYFERSERDHEICLQKAERDSVETRWCSEIKSATDSAYNSADSSTETGFLMIIILPILYGLIITVRDLKEKIAELTENLNV